jgi:2-iminobutanoate/2-iminopropanoate deaminase
MEGIRTEAAWGVPSLLSQAVRVGDLLFISGQVPRHPDGTLVSGDFEAEVRRTLDNIKAVVEAAGGHVGDVCKITAYLVSPDLFETFNKVYLTYFTPPMPARTTVICQLPKPFLRVEIDAIAALEAGGRQVP